MISYGYSEDLKDKYGVWRARTTGQLRLWEIPLAHVETVLPGELGGAPFPGLYILLQPAGKQDRVYIGETGNVQDRLSQHISRPPKEIGNFSRVVIISDARPTTQSDLSDAIIRGALESTLIELFQREENFSVVNKVRQPPQLNVSQRSKVTQYKDELGFILNKFGLLELPPPREIDQGELPNIKVKELLEKEHTVSNWSAYEATVDDKPCYIRPGSPKPKGWQITLRDKFRKRVKELDGFIIVPRGPGLLIPFKIVRELVGDDALKGSTVDIFIEFQPDRILAHYKDQQVDIFEYSIPASTGGDK